VKSAQTTAFTARTAAAETLPSGVRGLIGELRTLMADDDPRREAFGLSMPADPTPPEPVATLTLTPLGSGRVAAAWDYAVRATRFRAEAMIAGVDTDFQNKGSFKALETILKGFTAGQLVQVRVVAANDGGEAAPSPVMTVVVT
jgi:hypothetical protein